MATRRLPGCLAVLCIAAVSLRVASAEPQHDTGNDTYWCDVSGPIASACNASNWTTLSQTDLEICTAVTTVLPLMGCNHTYVAPRLDEPISTLLLL